jgi:hypothetical protein
LAFSIGKLEVTPSGFQNRSWHAPTPSVPSHPTRSADVVILYTEGQRPRDDSDRPIDVSQPVITLLASALEAFHGMAGIGDRVPVFADLLD